MTEFSWINYQESFYWSAVWNNGC